MLEDLEPHLIHAEVATSVETTPKAVVDDEGWSALSAPVEPERTTGEEMHEAPPSPLSPDDERAALEAELARLDAERHHRDAPVSATSQPGDAALADLESRLSNVEF
jgi:hypothetical protein